jgi:hypothetical protein
MAARASRVWPARGTRPRLRAPRPTAPPTRAQADPAAGDRRSGPPVDRRRWPGSHQSAALVQPVDARSERQRESELPASPIATTVVTSIPTVWRPSARADGYISSTSSLTARRRLRSRSGGDRSVPGSHQGRKPDRRAPRRSVRDSRGLRRPPQRPDEHPRSHGDFPHGGSRDQAGTPSGRPVTEGDQRMLVPACAFLGVPAQAVGQTLASRPGAQAQPLAAAIIKPDRHIHRGRHFRAAPGPKGGLRSRVRRPDTGRRARRPDTGRRARRPDTGRRVRRPGAGRRSRPPAADRARRRPARG